MNEINIEDNKQRVSVNLKVQINKTKEKVH